MSIVPFILDDGNATVVETKQRFDTSSGLDGKVILILNLDREQILNTKSSNASYDLRVGDEFRDHRDSNKSDLVEGGEVCLQPGAAVIIETAEYVQFPKARFGHIVPKVSLLQDGLSNTSSKIDPGYSGKLSITVFNLGKRTISLKKGQKFCTLYILDVQDGVTPYEKGPQRITGNMRTGAFSRARDFVETNQALLICISLIVSSLVGAIQVVQLISPQRPVFQSPNKVDNP